MDIASFKKMEWVIIYHILFIIVKLVKRIFKCRLITRECIFDPLTTNLDYLHKRFHALSNLIFIIDTIFQY